MHHVLQLILYHNWDDIMKQPRILAEPATQSAASFAS